MPDALKVTVDGVIYQIQAFGGISTHFREMLPRMCALDESLRVQLVTSGEVRQKLPTHAHIVHRTVPHFGPRLRSQRWWQPVQPLATQVVEALWLGSGKGCIWHSTYYTMPQRWDGWQVVTVMDMIQERFPRLFSRAKDDQFRERKRRCVREADAVICQTAATAQDLQYSYGMSADRIHVIPLAPGDCFRRLAPGDGCSLMPMEQPFLLCVGARYQHKNFARLLQAYSRWPQRKSIALYAVGPEWSSDERRRIEELGIEGRVRFLVDVDNEQLCRLYNQAAAFVYPSLYEGFGIPLLEAMACGCPIMASRIPSTLEVAGMCPIYFEPAETEGLLAAFDVALFEGRASERVRRGLEHVKGYSWDKTARQTLDVYRTLGAR